MISIVVSTPKHIPGKAGGGWDDDDDDNDRELNIHSQTQLYGSGSAGLYKIWEVQNMTPVQYCTDFIFVHFAWLYLFKRY